MGVIGDPITPAVPLVGSAGPQFAEDINAILTEIIARLSTKVPMSSVNFNSDLNMLGSKLLNVGHITLQNEAVSPVATPFNRLVAFGGDFWYVSPSGAIQITTGNQLNAAGLGGITGDYGGVNPAQFRYVAADSRYNAFSNFSTNSLGFVRGLGFDIAPSATSAVFARLLFGGGVNRTYTLPPAPATSADRPLYMDNAGQVKVGHGTVSYSYSAFGSLPADASAVFTSATFGFDYTTAPTGGGMRLRVNNTTDSCVKPLDGLPVGYKVTTLDFRLTKVGITNTRFQLMKVTPGSIAVQIGLVNTTTNGAQTQTMTLGAPETVASNASYYIIWFPNGGSNSSECWHGFTVNGTMDP